MILPSSTERLACAIALTPNRRASYSARRSCRPTTCCLTKIAWLWPETIVHPGASRVEHGRHGAPHDMDELELVEDGFEDREGESWQYGPMVLSWADLAAEISEPEAGHQRVGHEMAHKLDALETAGAQHGPHDDEESDQDGPGPAIAPF